MQEFLHFTGRQATGKCVVYITPESKTIVISHSDLREGQPEGGSLASPPSTWKERKRWTLLPRHSSHSSLDSPLKNISLSLFKIVIGTLCHGDCVSGTVQKPAEETDRQGLSKDPALLWVFCFWNSCQPGKWKVYISHSVNSFVRLYPRDLSCLACNLSQSVL